MATSRQSRPSARTLMRAEYQPPGATRADVGQGPDATWLVLADPDGNEFCVLRALRPDELAAD